MKGELGGVCQTPRCIWSRLQPAATHLDTHRERWVCFPCAQERNREALRYQINRPCISSQEYVIKLLKD